MHEPVSTVYWTPPSKSVWGLPKDAVPTVCFVFSISSQLRFTGMGFCCLISRVKGYTWAQMAGVYSESCCCSLFRTVFFRTLLLGKQGHFRIPVCGNWCHSACGIINENIYPLSIVQERVIQKRLLWRMLSLLWERKRPEKHLGGPERFWVEPDLLQPFDCPYPH